VIFPSSLKSLTFGTLCNQSLERIHFPDGLQELTLGGTGNKNMIEGRDWAKYSSLKWFTNVVYHNALIKDNNYNLIYVYSIYIYVSNIIFIYIYVHVYIHIFIHIMYHLNFYILLISLAAQQAQLIPFCRAGGWSWLAVVIHCFPQPRYSFEMFLDVVFRYAEISIPRFGIRCSDQYSFEMKNSLSDG
jgi:hypothetical protein